MNLPTMVEASFENLIHQILQNTEFPIIVGEYFEHLVQIGQNSSRTAIFVLF